MASDIRGQITLKFAGLEQAHGKARELDRHVREAEARIKDQQTRLERLRRRWQEIDSGIRSRLKTAARGGLRTAVGFGLSQITIDEENVLLQELPNLSAAAAFGGPKGVAGFALLKLLTLPLSSWAELKREAEERKKEMEALKKEIERNRDRLEKDLIRVREQMNKDFAKAREATRKWGEELLYKTSQYVHW